MKKLLVIFLLLIFPTLVDASTIEGNISGVSVVYEESSGGSGGSSFNCWYAQRSGQYGLRITFYTEDGTQVASRSNSSALSKSVDVWDWNVNDYAVGVYKGEVDGSFEIREEKDYTRGIGYKTKMDYLGGENLQVVRGGYIIYRDKIASAKDDKNNPLHYTNEGGQERLAEYFTTPEVVERYAKLADADIDVDTGTFYLLLEPVLFIYRSSSCDNGRTEYRGRYTSTEIGMLYSNWRINLSNELLRKGAYFGLMLAKEATFGQYTFKFVKGFGPKSKYVTGNNEYKSEYLTGQYAYGMGLISGKDVCKEMCGRKHYQIVYRTIDLAQPFLGINGVARTLTDKSNWYQKENLIDANVYKNDPFLVVTLSPIEIKSIREENKKTNYSSLTETTFNKFREKYKDNFKILDENIFKK